MEAARRQADRKHIHFNVIAGHDVGTGHVHRVKTLADALQHHDITAAVWGPDTDLGWIPQDDVWEADLIINDRLDTRPQLGRHINFEDHGEGARHADAVVNALYPTKLGNELTGPDWAVLRPEFQSVPQYEVRDTERVLVMFGGTDPSNLYGLASDALKGRSMWLPSDFDSVAEAMWHCDVLVTSAGRTVYEAARVGIPSVVLAQNNREATHGHLGSDSGNVYLGLGRLVSRGRLRSTVDGLLAAPKLRAELSERGRGLVDGRGVGRVVSLVDRVLKGERV